MKIKPDRRSLLIYGMLLIASIIWISFSGGALPYMTFYAVLCVPFASAVYLGVASATIRFFQETPSHKVTKAEQSPYRLRVENVGILPFVRITLLMETKLAGMIRLDEEITLSLKPGERWDASCEMVCRYAGTYYVGLIAYRIEDCFHLLQIEEPVPTPYRVIVCPRLPEEGDPLPDLEAVRNLLEMQIRSDTEPTLSSDLRDYRSGDSIRRIHWRNSARMQKLLTRLPEPREIQLIQVVMIPAAQSQALEDVIRRDRFLETAVAVAYDFCRQRKPAIFYYPKGSVKRKTVDSYESFWDFYENLPDEVRYNEAMDDDAWRAWIEENTVKEGGVLLLKENGTNAEQLSVYSTY